MIDLCPTPTSEADDDWGYCGACGCRNTGCSVMPPLGGCNDVTCIPCGHYVWWQRRADQQPEPSGKAAE
jgi:hypothetical protein